MPVEILYGLVAFLSMIVLGLIGVIWHIHISQQEKIHETLKGIFSSIEKLRENNQKLEASLHGDLANLDRRVLRIEEWRKGKE